MSSSRPSRQARGPGLPPPTPFERLQRIHALTVAGETCMAIALADSLFLSISPDAARGRVILFLAVSMAPFIVVAPLIGPAIDRMRGGQRMVVVLVGLLRAVVLTGMALTLDSLTLFPIAFAALILGKTYAISKSALVPVTVTDPEKLVEANSKLGQIAGIAGFVMAVPALVLQLIDTRVTLAIGALAFIGVAANARRLPKAVIADKPADTLEIEELHSEVVLSAALAMRVLRGAVGFMFFHLAFWLRSEIAGTAWFGFAVAMSGLATLGANFAGPHLRRRMKNHTMLVAALVVVALAGFGSAWWNRVMAGVLLAAVVNAAAAIGKLAFEATVQEGAPDANRGRAFARFETQNQLAWVAGGLVPVAVSPPGWVGFVIVGATGAVGAFLYGRSRSDITVRRGGPTTGRGRRPRSGSEDSSDQ